MAQPAPAFNPFAAGTADSDPTAEQARRELAAQIPEDVKVDLGSCFPEVTGRKATRSNKARLGYLNNCASVLRACLRRDETIRYLSFAREYVWWETFAAGHWALLLNSCVMVVSDARVLLIHCDRKGRPSRYVNQIRTDVIKQTKGFLGRVTIVLPSQKRRFNVGYGDRAALKRVLPEKNNVVTGAAELLCPACFTATREHVLECSSCGAPFKSPRTAAIRSALLPGLGALYTGDTGFAVLQIIRAIVMLLILFSVIAWGLGGGEPDALGVIIFVGLIAAMTYTIDVAFSYANAKKGLIALDQRLPSDPRR